MIPPEAGYPGLPIDDSVPEFKKSLAYQDEVSRPRRELLPDNSWYYLMIL